MSHDRHSSDRSHHQHNKRSQRNRNRSRNRDRHEDRSQHRSRSPRLDDSIEYIPSREIRESRDQRRRIVPAEAKPSLGSRLLKFLSFGLLGRGSKNKPSKPAKPSASQRPAHKTGAPPKAQQPKSAPSQKPTEPRKKQEPKAAAPFDPATIASARLHLGNLSYDATESDLFELFRGFGKVVNAEIVTHQRTQRSKGFGFVQMNSVEEARRAAEELHGKPFMGRPMFIGSAKPSPQREVPPA